MPSQAHHSRWFKVRHAPRLTRRALELARGSFAMLSLVGVPACSDVAEDPAYDCSLDGRKAFVADIMTDYYLWYDRVPPVDIAAAQSPEALLAAMTFRELDHWSGMQRTFERREFFDQGRFQGLGYTLGQDAQGLLRISWVHEGSAAGRAGLDRGAVILGVNGRAIAELSPDELGAELGRDVVVHQIRELDGTIHDVELVQGDVEITSVKNETVLDTPSGPVGYLMFTTFVLPGEDELKIAFADFRQRGITRLVIDLRYNSGGLLRTAALLGSLIEADAAGQPLIVETYNQRHSNLNRERLMFETQEGVNASHVVFLSSGRTASASEQVINGLGPYVKVDVVGSRTLGKPVGADSWNHCEYSITPITFHSLNVDGGGDYFDGIEPVCEVEDDLLHRLGDPEEAQLAAALRLLDGQPCASTNGASTNGASTNGASTNGDSTKAKGSAARIGRAGPAELGNLPAGPMPNLPGWY